MTMTTKVTIHSAGASHKSIIQAWTIARLAIDEAIRDVVEPFIDDAESTGNLSTRAAMPPIKFTSNRAPLERTYGDTVRAERWFVSISQPDDVWWLVTVVMKQPRWRDEPHFATIEITIHETPGNGNDHRDDLGYVRTEFNLKPGQQAAQISAIIDDKLSSLLLDTNLQEL